MLPIIPTESTVSRIEYEKLDQDLHFTKKRLDGVSNEVMLFRRQ